MAHKNSQVKFGPLVVIGLALAGMAVAPLNHSDLLQNNLLQDSVLHNNLVAVLTNKSKAVETKTVQPIKALQQFKWADAVQPTPIPAPPPQAQAKKDLKLPEPENTDLPDMTPLDFMQLSQNFTKKDNSGKPIERQGFNVQYYNKNIGVKPTGDFDMNVVVTCSRDGATKDVIFTRKISSFKPDVQPSNYFLVDEQWCPFEQVKSVTVIDDPHNKIEELNEKNNSWTYNVERDMTVEAIKQIEFIRNDDNDPKHEYNFKISNYPKQTNGSKEPVGKVETKITLTVNSNGKLVDYDLYDTPDIYFNPGWSYGDQIKVSSLLTTYDKLTKVTIMVDPFNKIPETDETNNVFSYNVEHDWTVEPGSVKVTDYGNAGVSFTVFYHPQRLIDDPVINYDINSDVILTFKNGIKTVDKIYHERSAIGAFGVKSEWGSLADLVAVKVIMDPYNLDPETNEANNEGLLVLQPKLYNPNGGAQDDVVQVQH